MLEGKEVNVAREKKANKKKKIVINKRKEKRKDEKITKQKTKTFKTEKIHIFTLTASSVSLRNEIDFHY